MQSNFKELNGIFNIFIKCIFLYKLTEGTVSICYHFRCEFKIKFSITTNGKIRQIYRYVTPGGNCDKEPKQQIVE